MIDPLEQNLLTFAVQFIYQNNQREVQCALVDQDLRKITVATYLDNEHYSTFESVILQTNPMNPNEAKFQVLCAFPELKSEREKVQDIFEQCEFEVIEKSKKDFMFTGNFEQDMTYLLQRPFKHYVQESACAQGNVYCLLQHLMLTREQSNKGRFHLEFMAFSKYLKLDLAAINALMIFPKTGIDQRFVAQEKSHQTLVEYLDKCKTAMGSRCLRRWVKMPLQNQNEINQRLSVVDLLINNQPFMQYIQRDFLAKIPDLDKLCAKFYKVFSDKKHNANLQDCIRVYSFVQSIKNFVNYAQKANVKTSDNILHEVFLNPFLEVIDDFSKLEKLIETSIDLQKAYQGDFIIHPRFSKTLQELDAKLKKQTKTIEDVRQNISAELGIDVVLGESALHTFVLECNKKQGDDAFRRASGKKYKTLTVKKGQITFTAPELQAEVVEYVHLKEEYEAESKELIVKILKIVSGYYLAMEKASQQISEIDVLCAFAHVARSAPRAFVKPVLTESTGKFILKDSRHPLLENVDPNCIINDLEMQHEISRVQIITGPNMGGKSTYIRQVAICALMAHIGCFIPCSYAQVPLLDAIITRVGASDMQLRGISTFMSEMLEASCMLKTATQKSLIIIDELGRGTSTSEGFGIAWAIGEYIAQNIRAYCLFATHFHEMTLMEDEIPCVKNFFVSCITLDDKITMQYKVRPGAVDRSYGLLVAQQLKFPQQVLEDAKAKAAELENFDLHLEESNQIQQDQMDVEQHFETINDEIEFYAKRSNLAQKEAVIRFMESTKLSKQQQKQEILRLLKS